MEELGKPIESELEELLRSCPRCGKASANKSNPAGRCSSCLKKLAANKKKPGHYLHNHKIADDAIRRQQGRNGSSPKKKSGHGTRKQIIDKVKSEEKKAGQVVSLDRKNNKKGYTPSNVRGVDPKLNRGRHKVDSKKLAAWKKKLKKHNIEPDDLMTLLRSKAYDKGMNEMGDMLSLMDIELMLSHLNPENEQV